MRPTRILLSLFAATCVPLTAQEAPKPAPELAKFDRMIGSWEGTGSVAMGPGQPMLPWTSKSRITKALDGHFIQEETAITFGGGMPETLRFVSLIGWDATTKKFKQWQVGNTGEAGESELHWADDDTFVSTSSQVEDGKLVVERWTTTLSKDSYHVIGLRATGAGKFAPYVEGTNKRVESVPNSAFSMKGSFNVPLLPEQMKKLAKLAGDYDVSGKMGGGPNGEMIDISGWQRVRPIFGGAVLGMYTSGEPQQYVAHAALTWSERDNCYRFLFANNRGEAGMAESRWVGNDLVTNMTGVNMGQPSAMRSVMKCDDKGTITGSTSHMMMGVADPMLVFDAKYAKR